MDDKKMTSPLEIVQLVYELEAKRQIPEVLALYAPEIEIVQTKQLPWGGHYRGLDEARDFLSRRPRFVEARPIPDRYMEAGDTIVVCGRLAGTVREFGTAFEIPIIEVWTVAGGLVTRFEPYVDTAEMLRILDEPAPIPPPVVSAPVAVSPPLARTKAGSTRIWTGVLVLGIVLALGPLWGPAVTALLMMALFHAMSQASPADLQHMSNQMVGAGIVFAAGFVACPIGLILIVVSLIFLIQASQTSMPPLPEPPALPPKENAAPLL